MQAILTKVLPCTHTKGTRIKATCARGSITLQNHSQFSLCDDRSHRIVVEKLIEKFNKEDEKKYGAKPAPGKEWNAPFVSGQLANGDFVHVFVV